MESPHDSDMSDDTRELVEQGLAVDRRKHTSRAGYKIDAHDPAPIRDMDTSKVRLPHVLGAISGESSTHGLSLTYEENVGGQNRNISDFSTSLAIYETPRYNSSNLASQLYCNKHYFGDCLYL